MESANNNSNHKKLPESERRREKVQCMSDSICPISGIWEVVGYITTTTPASKGQKMPKFCGRKVMWVLVREC